MSTRKGGRPSAAQQRLSSERAAAARARIAHAQRRRQLFLVGGSVLGIVVIVAVLIIVKVATGAGDPKSGEKGGAAPTTLSGQLAAVPASVFDTVGSGSTSAAPASISAPALTAGGLPRVLYVGAEYCPYCAAERWAMVVALSRFGTFSNLGTTSSSPSDVYPNTQTLSFHGASYTSKYLSFTGTEIESNQVVDGQYAPLDKLSTADQALFAKYDAPPYVKGSTGAIPFIDFGGKYVVSGATYDPGVLQGMTRAQIAAALSQPSSAVAKGVIGSANLISAAVCQLTGQQPGAVCSSAGVQAATSALHGSS